MKSKPRSGLVKKLESELVRDQGKLARHKRRLPREPVANYTLAGPRGPVSLATLFGGRRDLLVIHNMGRACPYCTMWADGFNGFYPHLVDRAAFAVVSPDAPATQKKFARNRGWRFPLFSGRGSTFSKDLGFEPKPGESRPGISSLQQVRGRIFRVATARFGPFDPFCSSWHLFALLADGIDGWRPKFRY